MYEIWFREADCLPQCCTVSDINAARMIWDCLADCYAMISERP